MSKKTRYVNRSLHFNLKRIGVCTTAGRQAASPPLFGPFSGGQTSPGDPVAIAFFIFPVVYHMAGLGWISRQADLAVAGRTGESELGARDR